MCLSMAFRHKKEWHAFGFVLSLFFQLGQPVQAGSFSLDGDWLFFPVHGGINDISETVNVDKFTGIQQASVKWEPIKVPGYWDQPPGGFPWTESTIPGGPYPKHDGEAWYRLNFRVPPEVFPPGRVTSGDRDHVGVLRFEGVSAQASVWLNGALVGKRVRGAYTPFEVTFPSSALASATNVLTVRVFDKAAFIEPGHSSPNSTSSIPLGFDPKVGGIYRPVNLRIVPRERILEVSVLPNIQALAVSVAVSDEAIGTSTLELTITEKETGTRIYGPILQSVNFDRSKFRGLNISISNLSLAKTWTPEFPSLYRLSVRLLGPAGGEDSRELEFGFRSFTARDGKFFLNGKPYFLFGAGSPPHYENPPEAVARAQLQALKQAGVRMVRFAHEPPAEFWLKICDELGLLAWIEGPLYADDGPYDLANPAFIDQASQEMTAIIRSLRSHPSAVIWSMGAGNCMSAARVDEGFRNATTAALENLVKSCSRFLPSPAYVVMPDSDNRGLLPSAVEDWHVDSGWYEGRLADWLPFLRQWTLLRKGADAANPPWVSSEIQSGYSSAGQGVPVGSTPEITATRMRIGTPPDDSAALLEFQSQRIRTLLEQARAFRDPRKNRLAGLFPFTCANWFYNPMTPQALSPKPILEAVGKAYSPVIVTMNGMRRHFYSGEILDASFTIAHDDIKAGTITTSRLVCEVSGLGGQDPISAQSEISSIGYYKSKSHSLALKLPETPTIETAKVRVRLISSETEIAGNELTVRIGNRAVCDPNPKDLAEGVGVYDPQGDLVRFLEAHKFQVNPLDNLTQLNQLQGLIIGPDAYDHYIARAWPSFEKWIQAGGRLLVLAQEKHESRWRFSGPYPGDYFASSPEGWPSGIDFVNLRIPDHLLFEGINRKDMSNWGNTGVLATSVLVRNDSPPTSAPGVRRTLADVITSSNKAGWGDIVYEYALDEGQALFCQLHLVDQAGVDPIAGIILRNALRWVGAAHRPVLARIPPPMVPFKAPLVGSNRNEVVAKEAGSGPNEPIRAVPLPNAQFETGTFTDQAGTRLHGIKPKSPNGEVYYDLDDRFWFDQGGAAEIQVQVICQKPSRIRLDYDSSDNLLGIMSVAKRASPRKVLEVGVWKILVFSVPDARFANRQYERCDFRLVVEEGDAVFGPITVRRSKS